MNAHSNDFDECPQWALAVLRAGLHLVDRERLQYELDRDGLGHHSMAIRHILLGSPTLSEKRFYQFREAMGRASVWMFGPSRASPAAGAVAFGQVHAGCWMTAARALLGWTRADVVGLPDVRLDYDRLSWAERRPSASIVEDLQHVFAAAGVQFLQASDSQSTAYGVYAPLEVLDPAASRAALHRLRGRHDERG